MVPSTQHTTVERFVKEFRSFLTETWMGYALILPASILMAIIIFYPTLRGIQIAFYEVSLLHPNDMAWVALENFAQIPGDPEFWNAAEHTVILTASAVALEYVLGLGLALALKEKVPGAGIFRSMSMITWVIPIVVMVVIYRFMVQPGYGVINVMLESLGLPTKYWFGDPVVALPLIVVMNIWRNVPFFAIALMASMRSIPKDLYEAASLDGAGSLQQFRYITLPQISYTSMIMIILHVIFTFNNFSIVYLSTGGGPLGATEVLPTYIYKEAFQSYAMGYAASVGVIMLILMVLFTAVYVKLETQE